MNIFQPKYFARRQPALWPGLLLLVLLSVSLAGCNVLSPSGGRDASANPSSQIRPSWTPSGLSTDPEDGGGSSADPFASSAQVTRRLTVLLMGVDNRPGEKIGRTDTIMVLTVDPQTGATGLISFARDLVVTAPGQAGQVKINTIYALGETGKYSGGGPAMLRATVSDLIGYPVDYYVRVNFDGFRQIVDQIDGIDIDVPKTINDPTFPDDNYGYDPLYIPAGRTHMDGVLALKYARTRHVDNDYGRLRRQQQVVVAIKDKLLQPGNLLSLLPRLPGLVVATSKSVQTDMPVDKMVSFARAINQSGMENPSRVVIDAAMGREASDPALGFILIPDLNRVRHATAAAFAGSPEQPGAAQPAGEATGVGAARIRVLNGTRQTGLATSTAATLKSDGYNVVGVGDADNYGYMQTWLIVYGDVDPVSRDTLIRQYAITPNHVRAQPANQGVDLELVLGADRTRSAGQP